LIVVGDDLEDVRVIEGQQSFLTVVLGQRIKNSPITKRYVVLKEQTADRRRDSTNR